MITTEAWVLHQGPPKGESRGPVVAELRRESFTSPNITEFEVLAEPIYGCWEGNMSHAVERDPVDICRQRGEESVVIGNAGVVRVLKAGGAVTSFKEGDLCLVFCNGVWDDLGYPQQIYAYDAPGTMGLLAKQTKLHEKNLIKIPDGTRFNLRQWAAFSLRHITAWANWKVAYGCLQLQLPEDVRRVEHVWGWGGGVTLAELGLAQFAGCRVAMIASSDERLELLRRLGITPVDRRRFGDLSFEQDRYQADADYRKVYQRSEDMFLEAVSELTGGAGVSIFIDFIGLPVFRATLKALARPGVITTAGWKEGMHLSVVRAIECMKWHTHVHTHYARYPEALAAVRFAEENGWMPEVGEEVYGWDELPRLAREYMAGEVSSYFPIYQVNQL